MSARENDLLRIQEIYDIATQTIAQLDELRLTREQFVHPSTTQQLLIGEGLTNRVLRAAEEGGRLSEAFRAYGFELREMSGLRNRLAHAYGTVDLHMIWEVLQSDFPKLVESPPLPIGRGRRSGARFPTGLSSARSWMRPFAMEWCATIIRGKDEIGGSSERDGCDEYAACHGLHR